MSQQPSETHSISTTGSEIRTAKCLRCAGQMQLVMFEPAEVYGNNEDAYHFRCDCGCMIRETVPRK